ncbi:MAG TPA: helicase-related protein, partial [Casimicrobiaceae bacterium]|nr:helicase-related protein [Casimicrobiaceae bacterium]
LPATARRQNLLFSATFSDEIKRLADALLNEPQLIEVARRNTTAETVAQSVYKVAADQKRALLKHIVTSRDLWQVLCFVRTKHGASRLARQLEKDGLQTTAIHGDKSQAARLEALDEFKGAKVQVMVATDVAARGLDIDDLPLVVNYEIPHVPEDYIHRIGRTGRAGLTGEAVSFCAPEEDKLFAEIERMLKRKIPVAIAPTFSAERHGTRETRAPRAARPAQPTRDRTARHTPRSAPPDAVDRNPDQPLPAAVPQRPQAPSALVRPVAAESRHRKSRPLAALLMKRHVPESESA